MNVNEFERNKPTETYKSILKVEKMIKSGIGNIPEQNDFLNELLKEMAVLKKNFKSGN